MGEAMEFLHALQPEGPWVLCAIQPSKAPVVKTFTPASEEDAERFIDDWDGGANLYFLPAKPRGNPSKKPGKADILHTEYLWVDIDPRAGKDLEPERTRILELLQSPPDGVPEPTFVVDSGRGFWGFWRLREPAGREAEAFMRELERRFGADSCHNIDRIARLPGTVNLKTRGRASKVSGRDGAYAIDEFPKAEPAGGALRRSALVPPAGEVALDSVDALDRWGVPDRVKAIIVGGPDQDSPKEGDNSRSAWLWDVVCNLVRCEVPDEVVFAVITDPDFAISESVLDKGRRLREYAARTIARARDEAVDPALRELNDRYMVVKNLGGKCRVVHEIDEFGRRKLVKQSFEDFRNAYLNRRAQVGVDKQGNPTYAPLGKWWLEHPRRRQFERIEFRPGREVEEGVYNLWRGFVVDPRPGDCRLFLEHIRGNICADDEDLYAYVESWMARAVQEPGVPGETAIVLRGGQGVGKSFFAKAFGRLFGQHYLHISNASHVVGNFNAHLRDCVLLFGDEAFYAGDKRHESQLKTLVTEYTLMIEGKGVDAESSPSCVHIILASNKQWVVPADADDRRFLVLDVGDRQKQNSTYFKAIQDQLDDGGYEALLDHLLSLDITGFDHRAIPDTAAKRDQKLRSLDVYQQIVFEMLEEGDSRSACEDADGHWVRGPELVRHISKGRSAETSIGRILSKISERKAKRKVDEHGVSKPRWCYLLKPLSRARAAFEEFVGFEIDWSDCPGWDEVGEVQDDIPF